MANRFDLIPSEDALSDELNYLRSVSLEGLTSFVVSAMLYFLVALAGLVWVASPRVLPFLLVQKSLYSLFCIWFALHLKARKFPVQRFDLYSTLTLCMCLSSGLFTALCGFTAPFGVYCLVLLLGTSMVEISLRRSAALWALIWVSWLAIFYDLPKPQFLQEIGKLVGIQLLSIPALLLRLRISLRQFRLVRELAIALSESEQTRAHLDLSVESRTLQLQMAYEELRLSTQERERLAQEQEKLEIKLLQSQKMESLGRLAGGVAHDFNNLLTVILGNLDLAKRNQSHGLDWLELVEEAETAGMRAAEVTGHLLAFSRKQVMKVTPLRIQEVIESSLKMVERLVGEDIQVDVKLDCRQAMVEGDVSRLQQVLLNLVVNARDAMPSGGRLEIGLREVGQEIELRVSDNGRGIDATLQKRIFEPFFTTKPLGEGTGLGLSTVDGIVSMHSGRIQVESERHRGSTFLVYLPALGTRSIETVARPLLEIPAATGSILLVEDDDQVRNLATRALQISGFLVHALENGYKALEWLTANPSYDLLVTDAVMPGMDGGKLAEAVRKQLPGLPVLFMSGYTDDRLSQFGIQRGECNFLAKPFTPTQLQSAVAGILNPSPA